VKFKDDEHRHFFETQVTKTNTWNDPYRKALFYTLGLTEQTRDHINALYNFKKKCIDFDGLQKPWQTGTSMKVTRLAFNLYNGFAGSEGIDDSERYTPYNLFDTGLMLYMFEAIILRYPSYADLEEL